MSASETQVRELLLFVSVLFSSDECPVTILLLVEVNQSSGLWLVGYYRDWLLILTFEEVSYTGSCHGVVYDFVSVDIGNQIDTLTVDSLGSFTKTIDIQVVV